MPTTRIWIVDGHNVIFAVPRLQGLQRSGRGEEARRGLVEALRRFAHARREPTLVVFDGDDPAREPDGIREPLFEVAYAPRARGGADDRIIRAARSRREQGHRVSVVTDDLATLAARLPAGVASLRVAAFWLKYVEQPVDQEGKRVEGDFSDLEREMEALAARENAEEVAVPAAAPPPPRDTSAFDEIGGRVRRKKERGRLRQKRRLGRRASRRRRE